MGAGQKYQSLSLLFKRASTNSNGNFDFTSEK
jgi:hypothetical protein